MATQNPIRIDPEIQGGTPCFAGTRLGVRYLFEWLKAGHTVDYFLDQFPTAKREQIEAALDFSLEALVASAERVAPEQAA